MNSIKNEYLKTNCFIVKQEHQENNIHLQIVPYVSQHIIDFENKINYIINHGIFDINNNNSKEKNKAILSMIAPNLSISHFYTKPEECLKIIDIFKLELSNDKKLFKTLEQIINEDDECVIMTHWYKYKIQQIIDKKDDSNVYLNNVIFIENIKQNLSQSPKSFILEIYSYIKNIK
jgi:hypothetical protein